MSRKKYPLRIPRFAAGIRTQESRSGALRVWWHRKWLEIVEGMASGGRTGRGRNYAMSGQVVKLEIRGPHVEAAVVGTRERPYEIALDFRAPEGDARKRIIEELKREPMAVARLLAGDLPTDLELVFRHHGYELFPGGRLEKGKYDMTTSCSCPDYANPCKHVSAVLIVLGEEVARRPLTLLELRGIEVEELLP